MCARSRALRLNPLCITLYSAPWHDGCPSSEEGFDSLAVHARAGWRQRLCVCVLCVCCVMVLYEKQVRSHGVARGVASSTPSSEQHVRKQARGLSAMTLNYYGSMSSSAAARHGPMQYRSVWT